jgi:hypothetical protein
LKAVSGFYEKKGKLPTSYKLSRKQAFLGIGNLSAAFQRMTQEPKRKQKNLEKVYEITVLNHNFLSSLASLGTYIQNHSTTKASTHFLSYAESIEENLDRCLKILDTGKIGESLSNDRQEEAKVFFDARYKRLIGTSNGENNGEEKDIGGEELKEAQLVYEQLQWLLEISIKLKKTILETKFLQA